MSNIQCSLLPVCEEVAAACGLVQPTGLNGVVEESTGFLASPCKTKGLVLECLTASISFNPCLTVLFNPSSIDLFSGYEQKALLLPVQKAIIQHLLNMY